jgi:uncharacterized protein YkwD
MLAVTNIRSSLRVLAASAGIAAAVLAAPSQALAHRHCAHAWADPNRISVPAAQKATLCLLNRVRRHHGLRRLRANHKLTLASQRHARSMAIHHYFDHGNFVGRIRAARYLRGAHGWTLGENIAWGSWTYATPASIVHGWMHSPGHRANILNRSFHEIGIGVARGAPVPGQGNGGTYVTDFGTRL